jgi:hypothetical protein
MLPAVYSSQRLNIMAWLLLACFNGILRQIASWCVFKQSTRTNNDVEGWHRRLNKKTDDEKPPFYLLVRRLYEEAQLLPIQRKLVSEGKLSRYQRKQASKSRYPCLFEVADEFKEGCILCLLSVSVGEMLALYG